MFFIRALNSSGESKFCGQTFGTHKTDVFLSYPDKLIGFLTFYRAFSLMSTLQEKYPDLSFDVLCLDTHGNVIFEPLQMKTDNKSIGD